MEIVLKGNIMYKHVEKASDLPEDEYLSANEILEMHNRLVDLANELVKCTIGW